MTTTLTHEIGFEAAVSQDAAGIDNLRVGIAPAPSNINVPAIFAIERACGFPMQAGIGCRALVAPENVLVIPRGSHAVRIIWDTIEQSDTFFEIYLAVNDVNNDRELIAITTENESEIAGLPSDTSLFFWVRAFLDMATFSEMTPAYLAHQNIAQLFQLEITGISGTTIPATTTLTIVTDTGAIAAIRPVDDITI